MLIGADLKTRCIATCGSNIDDYEVVQAYGIGTTTVNCSAHNYALGCGFKPGKEFCSAQQSVLTKIILNYS
jgi:hypothetical protein